MSPIIGNYVNNILNATLSINAADDSTGAISGVITLGRTEIPIKGVWNASTVAPNGLLCFTGGFALTQVGGAGQTDNFSTFSSINLGFNVAQKDTGTTSIAAKFNRA